MRTYDRATERIELRVHRFNQRTPFRLRSACPGVLPAQRGAILGFRRLNKKRLRRQHNSDTYLRDHQTCERVSGDKRVTRNNSGPPRIAIKKKEIQWRMPKNNRVIFCAITCNLTVVASTGGSKLNGYRLLFAQIVNAPFTQLDGYGP